MGKVCCIERCRNQSKAFIPPQTVVSLYRFPQDDYCSNMWREFCRENGTTVTENMQHRRICSRHFDDEVFKDPSDVLKGLKRHAVPTLFEIELLQDVQYLEIHREQVKQSLRIEKSKTEDKEVLKKGTQQKDVFNT